MVPEMSKNRRAHGRATEGAASRESGRAMEAPENNANGWEANKNGSRRSTWRRDGEGCSTRFSKKTKYSYMCAQDVQTHIYFTNCTNIKVMILNYIIYLIT
jgi:hypothetical protein